MEADNPNKTLLPRDLWHSLFKLHLAMLCLALLLVVLGGITISILGPMVHMTVVLAGIASLVSSLWGLLAYRTHSIVLHSGTIVTSAVALWFGLQANLTCLATIATLTEIDGSSGLVICDMLFLTLEVVMAALLTGVEASVLWVSSKQRKQRLQGE